MMDDSVHSPDDALQPRDASRSSNTVTVSLTLNGEPVTLEVEPNVVLLDALPVLLDALGQGAFRHG